MPLRLDSVRIEGRPSATPRHWRLRQAFRAKHLLLPAVSSVCLRGRKRGTLATEDGGTVGAPGFWKLLQNLAAPLSSSAKGGRPTWKTPPAGRPPANRSQSMSIHSYRGLNPSARKRPAESALGGFCRVPCWRVYAAGVAARSRIGLEIDAESMAMREFHFDVEGQIRDSSGLSRRGK